MLLVPFSFPFFLFYFPLDLSFRSFLSFQPPSFPLLCSASSFYLSRSPLPRTSPPPTPSPDYFPFAPSCLLLFLRQARAQTIRDCSSIKWARAKHLLTKLNCSFQGQYTCLNERVYIHVWMKETVPFNGVSELNCFLQGQCTYLAWKKRRRNAPIVLDKKYTECSSSVIFVFLCYVW